MISQFGEGDDKVLAKLTLDGVDGGAFNSLLGPLVLILSQALAFLKEVINVVANPDWEQILVATTVFLVVTRKSKWALVGGAYVLLTMNDWMNFWTTSSASDLKFSPFNIDALDASWSISIIVWSLTFLGYLVTLHLAVGAWRHIAVPAADRTVAALGLEGGTTTSVDAESDAGDGPAVSDDSDKS